MSRMLYIAAKAPRPGVAKTRLGNAIGHAAAVMLYRAFVCDLATRFAPAPFRVGWYITPPDAWPELAPLVAGAHAAPPVLAQGPGDWTERQRALFQSAAERGETRVVLIASDSPQLGVDVIEDAFRLLETHDVVFGPVHDGGYYLIGMRGWHDILRGVAMSTGSVLEQLLARGRALGLSVALVAPTFDVDEAADLDYLRAIVGERGDLQATRAALAQLGAQALAEGAEPCQALR